jgi:hypothetical protein
MSIPQWAFAKTGAPASESIIARNAAFVPLDAAAGAGADTCDLHAVHSATATTNIRTSRMHPLESWRREEYSRMPAWRDVQAAISVSSAVFPMMNRRAGSTTGVSSAVETRVNDGSRASSVDMRSSPASSAASMIGTHAGVYIAQNGSRPREPSGTVANDSSRPRSRISRSRSTLTNGMSQATTITVVPA